MAQQSEDTEDPSEQSLLAHELFEDDVKQPSRRGESYADKGSHGHRHNHTHQQREIEKFMRRSARKER